MHAPVLEKGLRARVLSPSLTRLIDTIRCYRQSIPEDELLHMLTVLDLDVDAVADYCLFHDHHYVRNLIYREAHAEILCMCWLSGQRSPIHDHNQSNCVVHVLQGVMTNIDFTLLPSGYLRPVGSSEHAVGATEARSEANIHQVANLQPAGCNLVTLHVYSPPLTHMNVFSLDKPCPPQHYYPAEYGLDGEGI
jgi:cysteine dioxygenase